MDFSIREAESSEVEHLIAESTRLLLSLYPEESNHLVDATDLGATGNILLGALENGQMVGCVGLVRKKRSAEVKRLFVLPQFRGRGIARVLMSELESRAYDAGYRVLRLETGIHQPESMALYESLGYRIRPPFGGYVADPLSVFMQKNLS
jgi:putative acetyltransferase